MDTSRAPESFRSLLLRGRGRSGLTQRDLAARAEVSLRSVQDWEAGVTLPTAERLKGLVRALLEAGGLSSGHEAHEALELWTAVERETPRKHAPFDDEWFAGLLTVPAPQPRTGEPATGTTEPMFRFVPRGARVEDWGEAPDTAALVGRGEELALLQQWVLDERCRLVAVLGLGGIGKTSLAAWVAMKVAPTFERVYWRSLRNAPAVSEWLAGAIGFLSDQQVMPPEPNRNRSPRCCSYFEHADACWCSTTPRRYSSRATVRAAIAQAWMATVGYCRQSVKRRTRAAWC